MANERYTRGANSQDDYYGRREVQDYGRDYGSGRDYGYSSARDYAASDNRYGRDDDRQRGYGRREYGSAGQGEQRSSRYGAAGGYDRGYGRDDYHGSYASDGRRFEDVGNRRDWDDDNRYDPDRSAYGRDGGRSARFQQGRPQQSARGGYGQQPQGYDYDDRGFLARAGDEVRSWFGDEDAERRREFDSRYDERAYNDRDSDYHNWRSGQIAALDRDYDEYRQQNRSKFQNEFSTWRSGRQTQRDALGKVKEHAEVLGSDGAHVGTVDKVRGDRILLTKNDADAGGQHHSIPSSWIATADEKNVTLTKSADEAKRHWRDEENNQALFDYGDRTRGDRDGRRDGGSTNLNRSFSGTY